LNYWWVITIGVAGGFTLAAALFFSVLLLRRVRERSAAEKQNLMVENERRLTELLDRATVMGGELKAMSRELLNVQEDERKKISRELHDEVGQLLAAMTVNLELMKKGLRPADELFLKEKISDTEHLASEMFGRIRTFLSELRPAALDHLGLMVVVKRLLIEFSHRTEIDVEMSGEFDALDDLDGDKRIVVFRLIQECLTNILKHAHANRIRVSVRREAGFVLVEITDDGAGFLRERNFHEPGKRGGMGILGMRERMGLVGGDFRIESVPGNGTTVRARIPLLGESDNTVDTTV
jgi:two-component system, NarL family, sensor histidine kinase DegS